MATEEPAAAADKPDVVCLTVPPVTDRERELGAKARSDFTKGQYDSCMKTLHDVISSRSTDAKVHHNKALTEYYQNGLTKTEEFLKGLEEVCDMCQINLSNVNNLDDVDYCVIYYNYALVLFYTKQYQTALCVLDKLFQFIEPLEENLRRKVLFLMVDLYLATQQPEKAHAILNFTEKSLFGNGNKSQQPTPEKDKERESRGTPPNASSNEIWRPKISQYKVRCYLMLKSVKACKREIKNLMSAVGLGSQLVYLKSNFEYLRANYRKTIKLLNTAPKQQSPEENLPMMYYNNLGCIHFHMQKHNLGAFYFKRALTENESACMAYSSLPLSKCLSGPCIRSLSMSRHNELIYNLGVQLLHSNKLEMAFDCLLQVVQYYHINPRLWLRLAECCIQQHRESNEEDSDLAHRMDVVKGSMGSGLHRKLILGTGNVNKRKQDRLSNKEGKSPYSDGDSPAVPALTLEFGMLCLKNALFLLPDDRSTPPCSGAGNSSAGTSPSSSSAGGATSSGYDDEPKCAGKMYDAPIQAPPSAPIRGQEIINLKSSILCHMAYVSLCLSDYLMSVKYSERLLQQPKLSGAHKYLGTMYIAEAYVALDRIADAIQHLQPEQVTDLTITVPDAANKQDQEKGSEQEQPEQKVDCPVNWWPNDLNRARAIMQFNLASAHAIRGEHEKALKHLASSRNQVGDPYPAQVYYLMLYLDLVEGHRSRAQGVIKQHYGHVTPNKIA